MADAAESLAALAALGGALGTRAFAWTFAGAICAGLAVAFHADGFARIALLYAFLVCLVVTQLSVHWVLRDLRFQYSTFLTFLQFAACCLPVVPFAAHARPTGLCKGVPSPMPFRSRRFLSFYARKVMPVVFAISVSVAANNASLGLIDPGLNAVLGNMTPACTGILSALLGARLPSRAWLAIGLAIIGGCITVQGGLAAAASSMATTSPDKARGVALSFGAMLFRALKTVVIDRSVRAEGRGHEEIADPILAPMQLLMLQTPAITLALLLLAALDPAGLAAPCAALWRGSLAAMGLQAQAPADGTPAEHPLLLLGVATNILAAGALNVAGLCVVQQIGATAMQIVGKCNIFIVMALSAAYNGEAIAASEVVGAVVVLYAAKMFTAASAAAAAERRRSPQAKDAPPPKDAEVLSTRQRRVEPPGEEPV